MRRWIPVGLFFGVLLALSTLHLYTGLADNGDFERDICPFMTKPVGFSAYTPADPVEHERRFVHHWYDRWELRPGFYDVGHVCQGSAHQVLILGEVLLNKLLYSRQQFSLVLGSLVPRLIVWMLFLAFCAWFQRLLPTGYWFLIPSTLLWLLFNDSVFAGLINSFYEDLSGIVWFCCALLGVVRHAELGGRRWLYLAGASLALLTATKTGYILSPILFFASFLVLGRERRELMRVAILCVVALGLAAPLHVRDSNRPINAYHAVYLGPLELMSPAELAPLVQPAGRFERDCVGQTAFANRACYERHEDESHATAVRLYLTHPRTIFRALDTLRREAIRLHLDLGMDRDGTIGYAQLSLFNVWARLMPLVSLSFYPLLLLSLGLVGLSLWRKWLPAPLAFALVLTLATSLTQLLMILADGLADYGRHGLLGTFTLCLFLVLGVVAGLRRVALTRA